MLFWKDPHWHVICCFHTQVKGNINYHSSRRCHKNHIKGRNTWKLLSATASPEDKNGRDPSAVSHPFPLCSPLTPNLCPGGGGGLVYSIASRLASCPPGWGKPYTPPPREDPLTSLQLGCIPAQMDSEFSPCTLQCLVKTLKEASTMLSRMELLKPRNYDWVINIPDGGIMTWAL